jgi:hypothetical protein
MPMLVRALLAAFLAASSAALAADRLAAGEKLDQSTWQRAEGLLPPEILRHYKDGEYANAIVDWPESQYNWPPDFLAASKANEGKFTAGERGDVLEKASGKQPPWILGHPFPTIDPGDPAAGVKIVWNQFYRFWYFGNLHAESQVNWISPKGLERRTDQDVRFLYYDGVPEDQREPNPHNFITQQLILVKTPADLNGTAALTWRYRDPEKRDSTWSYVPALRRVRAVSPANRSDGFLGSDMSQDDGPFFDGKPEDFEWKLKGEAEQYRLAEALNLKGESKSRWVEGRGWDADWPDTKFLGYMDPEWRGVAWAPTGPSVLANRRFWIVEGVPRDKYYLYGRLELWIDKLTYQGAWHRKFSWKGELLGTMQVMAWNPLPYTRPNGKVDYNQGSNMAYQCAENLKLNRATVAGIKSSNNAGFYGRTKFDPAIFDVDALARSGK